jgi:hypothetical protein
MTENNDPEVTIADEDLPMDFDLVPVEPKKEEKPLGNETEKKADDPIESLKRQYEDMLASERSRAEKAEKEASEYRGRYTQASGETYDSNLNSIDTAIELRKQQVEQAERDYASALEIADYERAAKIQRTMGKADFEISQLEYGKREIETRRRTEETRPNPQASGIDDTIDGVIAASSSKAQDYIRRNRSHLKSDRDVNGRIGAHKLAIARGKQPDTDDSFNVIDTQMGWAEQATEAKIEQNKPAQRTVSAPVSRDTAASNGDLSNSRITLTREQVQVAEAMGMTPAQYAKNLIKLKANGKDPSANGPRLTADIN